MPRTKAVPAPSGFSPQTCTVIIDGEATRASDGLVFAYAIRVQFLMRISSYSELRRNLAAEIDRVNADREPVIITRDRGKPMAVLMSLEDFASYEETRHLLRSAKNAERLLEAIGELDRGGGKERSLAE
ncbi:MAG TPA: type II toxin-antitoxin system prevent-host-death family antitoxin [Roseiarcus sp.]|nr:type II toxin-antitoxin system prevent-host-death family antitoxin [Roseiarcus sp.]